MGKVENKWSRLKVVESSEQNVRQDGKFILLRNTYREIPKYFEMIKKVKYLILQSKWQEQTMMLVEKYIRTDHDDLAFGDF